MGDTRVIQVTNVAPAAQREQMKTLFGFLGKVEECRLYPEGDLIVGTTSKVGYVKYDDTTSVGVALHLTNTVFIDRALIVSPCPEGQIPDEMTALKSVAPAGAVAGVMPPSSSWPSNVVNQVTGVGVNQVITTVDPRLSALGLPLYPPLPGNVDPSKIEEIRRTVYVGNLESTVTAEQLLNFFSQVGEIKYVRMAGDETQPSRFSFVEFSDQTSVATALTYNGVMFAGRPLKVNHSNNAIVKPPTKSQEAAQREIEEAMKKVKEAQSLITAAIDPIAMSTALENTIGAHLGEATTTKASKKFALDRRRSRSRSRSRRHRSGSRTRRSRSRSRRSRSHGRRSKRRSRSKKRSPSRSRRSKSRGKRRSRSRSRDRRKKRSRSRTPPRGYRAKKSRSRSRDRFRRSKSRKRSKSRSKSPVKKKKVRSRTPSPAPKEELSSPARDEAGSKSPIRKSVSPKRKSVSPKRRSSRSPAMKKSRSPRRRSRTPPHKKSHSPFRRRSRSPRKRSSRSPRRSRTPRRRSRTPKRRSRTPKRSRSPRHKKDKKKDRDRSRDRDSHRERSSRKRRHSTSVDRDVDVKKESRVIRNYDEEEKGYDSEEEEKRASSPERPAEEDNKSGAPETDNLQQMDMDMDSD